MLQAVFSLRDKLYESLSGVRYQLKTMNTTNVTHTKKRRYVRHAITGLSVPVLHILYGYSLYTSPLNAIDHNLRSYLTEHSLVK